MYCVYPKFKGKPVIPSRAGANELVQEGMSLAEVVEILENGFDCPRSKRAKGVIEKCVRKGKKTLKVVVAESYNYSLGTDCWLLIHVGRF